MMRPVNVAGITAAVANMLSSHPDLQDVTVIRAGEVNKEPTVGGWVGVYRAAVRYSTRALGAGVPRAQRVSLVILVQHSDHSSGADCEDQLEALIQKVTGVILSDESLGGTVDVLDPNEFEIRYESYNKLDNIFLQTAAIYLTGLVQVGVQ